MKELKSETEKSKPLYDEDFHEWLRETIDLLQSRKFEALDIEHLIEELTDLGKSERNAVEHLLDQVIRHLLLLQYWTDEAEYNASHWQGEIYSFRIQLRRKLTTNLRNYLASKLNLIYQDALGFVKIKTKKSITFPSECPYSLEQLLDIDWLPIDINNP